MVSESQTTRNQMDGSFEDKNLDIDNNSSNGHITHQKAALAKNYLKFTKNHLNVTTTAPLTPNYWEMQRTDSDHTIIRMPEFSTTYDNTQTLSHRHESTRSDGTLDANKSLNASINYPTSPLPKQTSVIPNAISLLHSSDTVDKSSVTDHSLQNYILASKSGSITYASTTAIVNTDKTVSVNNSDLLPTFVAPQEKRKIELITAATIPVEGKNTKIISALLKFPKLLSTNNEKQLMNSPKTITRSLLPESLQQPIENSDFPSATVFHQRTTVPSAIPLAKIKTSVNDKQIKALSPSNKNEKNSYFNSRKIESAVKTKGNSTVNLSTANSMVPESMKLEELDQTFINGNENKASSDKVSSSENYDLSSIIDDDIDDTFQSLIHFEKQQMGISIPKSRKAAATRIILANLSRLNGVKTLISANSNSNNGMSFKHKIVKGNIIETQKLYRGGQQIKLKLWNPVVYGHDWFANAGAIIHGNLRPLQSKIISVKSQNDKVLNGNRILGSRFFSNENQTLKLETEQVEAVNYVKNLASDGQKSEQSYQCFYVKKHCVLSAVVPFERRIGMNLAECAKFCTSSLGCHSASYSPRLSSCDVYHLKFGSKNRKMLRSVFQYYLEPRPDNSPGCSAACEANQRIILMKSPGWRLLRQSDQNEKFLTTEGNCHQYCYENKVKKNKFENRINYQCTSAVFDTKSKRCELYQTIHHDDTLIFDSSSIYYEKNCFPDRVAKLCQGSLIERQPQRILLGFLDAVFTTSTLAECFLKCFSSNSSLQNGQPFQCRSVIYFYEQKEDNCILDSKSKRNRGKDLSREMLAVVDYFDFDECLNASVLVIIIFN
ncbi:unnamed protein product [Thelazia callipaeda]|uniref:PAN domain-containing protein n=1 Tax=Thelazia callipaeda TaxID=103827 RepID=A0A0N5DAH6_THECL|nr:unnamed protein product [Thelazia callipaeda]